jgi:hypothetical protein
MMVNAVNPIVARWLAKAKQTLPWTRHKDLPLEEFALEDRTIYYLEPEDGSADESELEDDDENDNISEGSRRAGHVNVDGDQGLSRLLVYCGANSYGSTPTASGELVTANRLLLHVKRDSGFVSSKAFARLDHEGDDSVVGPRRIKASEVARMTREQYCREILLPYLFRMEDLSTSEVRREGLRLLAYLIAADIWVDVFKIPARADQQPPPRHELCHMEDVIHLYATQRIIVFTSLTVKGRIGHTLDTYIGPFVLLVLLTSETFAWSLYISEVIINFSDQLTHAEMFQLVCFRVVNSGAVTSLSLLLVKYVISWRLGRGMSVAEETRYGDLPPVAAATRARFLFTWKIHILTVAYLLIELPMLLVGIGGMVLYPFVPFVMFALAWASRQKLSPVVDRALRKQKLVKSVETLQLIRVLVGFVLEQQIPALALAISLQACANYLLLFTHRDVYQLTYGSVMLKELYSRSTACFERQLREDLQEFMQRSAAAVQWLTALVPGA